MPERNFARPDTRRIRIAFTMPTLTVDLSQKEQMLLLEALALGIEAQNRSIERCSVELRSGIGVAERAEAIRQRRRLLTEFERVRQRLLSKEICTTNVEKVQPARSE